MTSILTDEMRAVAITKFGGPEVLALTRLAVPCPGAGEVLIKVVAAGVNRPDVIQRMGKYPPPSGAPDTPGLEIAGTVVAAGAGVDGVEVGNKVCALVAGGGVPNIVWPPRPSACPCPRA